MKPYFRMRLLSIEMVCVICGQIGSFSINTLKAVTFIKDKPGESATMSSTMARTSLTCITVEEISRGVLQIIC